MQWGLFSEKGLRSIEESTARLNLWHGAVRSSKTINSIVRWLEFIRTAPPGDLLMVGKTERTLKRNILGPIQEMVGPSRFRHNVGTGEVFIFGRRIYTAGANDERSAGKIRGMTLVGAYGDEMTLWPEGFFQELLNRLSVKGAKFFGTTNPDSPFHWLKANYLDREGELNLRSWHFELTDNPNLDPEYIESLKAEHTGLWYDRMIRGLWVQADGVIYDQFDLEKQGYDAQEAPSFDSQAVAIDYGTQNPFAALLVGRTGATSWVQRELYYSGREALKQRTDAEHADALLAWLGDVRPRWFIVDPSAASFIAELKSRGIHNVKPAVNDVIDGIRTVSSNLTAGRLRIHRTACPNLLKEFAGYVWDAKAAKTGTDKPVKTNDHALDALRYYCATIEGIREFIPMGVSY